MKDENAIEPYLVTKLLISQFYCILTFTIKISEHFFEKSFTL